MPLIYEINRKLYKKHINKKQNITTLIINLRIIGERTTTVTNSNLVNGLNYVKSLSFQNVKDYILNNDDFQKTGDDSGNDIGTDIGTENCGVIIDQNGQLVDFKKLKMLLIN